jgi:hypothetical protein
MKFRLIDSSFLKHPDQNNPCYRKIPCYAYFRYIKENDLERGLIEFERLHTHVKENRLYILNGFFEFYTLQMTANGEHGYLAVESSRGCYPLVFYPEPHSHHDNNENKTRKAAFTTAINKVYKNRKQIFKLLDEHNEWTLELERKLEKHFEYKQKPHSNDDQLNDSIPKTR